jgi:two-component system response regulator HydG
MHPTPRCVVIDHDPDFLEQVKRCLASTWRDCEVVSFRSSIDAIEFIRERRVDLILTAYLVPAIDGLQLIRLVRSFDPRVPILMLSSVPVKAAALAQGATAFLAKSTLWRRLDAVLARVRDHRIAQPA